MLTLVTIRYQGSIQAFGRNVAMKLLLEKAAERDMAQSRPPDDCPMAIYPSLTGLAPEAQ